MKQQMLRQKVELLDSEKELQEEMEAAREERRKWVVREIRYRDWLIVSLHKRLPHAAWEIARVLGESHSFVEKELQRLFQTGKLKRKWKGRNS